MMPRAAEGAGLPTTMDGGSPTPKAAGSTTTDGLGLGSLRCCTTQPLAPCAGRRRAYHHQTKGATSGLRARREPNFGRQIQRPSPKGKDMPNVGEKSFPDKRMELHAASLDALVRASAPAPPYQPYPGDHPCEIKRLTANAPFGLAALPRRVWFCHTHLEEIQCQHRRRARPSTVRRTREKRRPRPQPVERLRPRLRERGQRHRQATTPSKSRSSPISPRSCEAARTSGARRCPPISRRAT